jgi:hypothetical protein
VKIKRTLEDFFLKKVNPLDFAVARIFFFGALICYYSNRGPALSWFSLDWKQHWVPISFFQYLPVDFFSPTLLLTAFYMFKVGLWGALLGLLTPISIVICFAGALFHFGFGLNFGKVNHSDHFVVMALFFLCFTKNHTMTCDQAIMRIYYYFQRKEPPPFESSTQPNWPIQALVLYMCFAYFEAAAQKLRNSGLMWATAENLSLIILTRPGVPHIGIWVANQKIITSILAVGVLVLEFFAPLALLRPYLKLIFGLGLFSLHIGTLILMGPHGGFIPYSLCFILWVPWVAFFNALKKGYLRVTHALR